MDKFTKKVPRFAGGFLLTVIMFILPSLSMAAITMTTNVASPQVAAESLEPSKASILFIVGGEDAGIRTNTFKFLVREQVPGAEFELEQNKDASTAPFGAFLFRWLTSDPRFAPVVGGDSRVFEIKVVVQDSTGGQVGTVIRKFQLDPLGDVPPDPNSFFGLVDSKVSESFELDNQNLPRFKSTTAAAYYRAIDPANERKTFNKFLQKNGMLPVGKNIGAGADGDKDVKTDAHALYINKIDLGFARYFKFFSDPVTGNMASYTENYPSIKEATDRENVIATVAMEYRADEGGLVTFYAYDGEGKRLQAADLDGRGFKAIPGTCVVCHGGKPAQGLAQVDPNTVYPNGGDLGSSLLPWDINAFTFNDDPKLDPNTTAIDPNNTLTREAQEADIKILNQAVLSTLTGNETKSPEQELIEGWYGGVDANGQLIKSTLDIDFVPPGWSGVEESNIYLHVIRETCRGCHITRPDDLAFGSAAAFDEFKDAAQQLCFDVVENPESVGSGEPMMPESQETFQRHFWVPNKDGDIPAELLRDYLASIGAASEPAPPPEPVESQESQESPEPAQ